MRQEESFMVEGLSCSADTGPQHQNLLSRGVSALAFIGLWEQTWLPKGPW